MYCVNVVAVDVNINPSEHKAAPIKATFRKLKYFKSGPLINPINIMHAEFVFMIVERSVCERSIFVKMSLNRSPKLCNVGMIMSWIKNGKNHSTFISFRVNC